MESSIWLDSTHQDCSLFINDIERKRLELELQYNQYWNQLVEQVDTKEQVDNQTFFGNNIQVKIIAVNSDNTQMKMDDTEMDEIENEIGGSCFKYPKNECHCNVIDEDFDMKEHDIFEDYAGIQQNYL